MKRVLALVSVLFTLLFALPGWADDAPAAAAAVTQAVAPVAAAVADVCGLSDFDCGRNQPRAFRHGRR